MLCHGVTQKTIQQKITESRGYHIIHWSGHGHLNKLEILGEDGKSETITGAGLVNLIQEAGGFVPMLVFLSACLSGAVVSRMRWNRPSENWNNRACRSCPTCLPTIFPIVIAG
ncbi:MAG: hypothetical protein ABIK98_12615 [Pseudomonadota bacterium]|uniref:CHAT domain-containing protein n=1 Tax=Candidatus Desulfatibia profunda TaxID=2841695 RepID=A0A8J6NY96_9BACT|nr:hypothetical protein [Candidatus Desulfatibia profunda]MBL7181216.1 hypothetical protein [Desulfobacterales bacterium]